MLFYVTIQSGRTDNFYVECNSKNDILTFLDTVSDAHVSCIKKVVYSKKYLINATTGALAPNYEATKELKILVKTENYTRLLNFRFPLKNISNEFITKQIKKYITVENEKIETVLNIVRA
ncbi:MAG: hypothetical protein ACQERD_00985 [Campylobacterota bacterium]